MRVGDTVLERFTLTELLGEGGMGVVFRAIDRDGRQVAVKRLHAEIANTPGLMARFEREAEVHALLTHPNIAALHAVGSGPGGALFFVLELVEGSSLADALDDGPIEIREAVAIARQILSALHHAHQFGVVHRDLKPDNVLLTVGDPPSRRVKLIDFGLVKMLQNVLTPDQCDRLTATGMVFGTPTYMPPEQIMGHAVDARTDLYALGITLYEMLVGRPPFESDEISELWNMHLSGPIPSLGPHGTEDLDAIVSTLLAKSPDERFGSALAVTRALDSTGL